MNFRHCCYMISSQLRTNRLTRNLNNGIIRHSTLVHTEESCEHFIFSVTLAVVTVTVVLLLHYEFSPCAKTKTSPTFGLGSLSQQMKCDSESAGGGEIIRESHLYRLRTKRYNTVHPITVQYALSTFRFVIYFYLV